MRIAEKNGKIFNYKEAMEAGAYDLCNKCDELADIFEEECRTTEERIAGYTCGEWHIYDCGDDTMTKKEKAYNALYKAGFNSALVSAMREDEVMKTFCISDIDDLEEYMNSMAAKYRF